MLSSITGVGTVQTQSTTESTAELTAEQKQKIAAIIAKYEAKEISLEEEQKQIAEVKASAVKKKAATKQETAKKEETSKTKENTAAVTTLASAQKEEAAEKLKELLKNSKTGTNNQDQIEKTIDDLKTSTGEVEGLLVDTTV